MMAFERGQAISEDMAYSWGRVFEDADSLSDTYDYYHPKNNRSIDL